MFVYIFVQMIAWTILLSYDKQNNALWFII